MSVQAASETRRLTLIVNTANAPDQLPAVLRARLLREGLEDLDGLLGVNHPVTADLFCQLTARAYQEGWCRSSTHLFGSRAGMPGGDLPPRPLTIWAKSVTSGESPSAS